MGDIIDMFGIPLFECGDGYYDVMEDGIQYKADTWKLNDMEKYNGKYVVIGFNGSLKVYEEDGRELFNGWLIDSKDFYQILKRKTES